MNCVSEQSAPAFEAPWGDSPRLRPHYGNALYAARLEGYPGPRDTWFTFSPNGAESAPAVGLLVRGPVQLTWPDGLRAIDPKRVDAPPPPC